MFEIGASHKAGCYLIENQGYGGWRGSRTSDASLFRAVFFEPKPFFNQQLNSSRWPIYCDHSVTSADVRLSVGAPVHPGLSYRCLDRSPRNTQHVEVAFATCFPSLLVISHSR